MNKLLSLLFIVLMFTGCYVGDKHLYPDVLLTTAPNEEDKLQYLKSGEPFTGTQTYRYTKTDSLYSVTTFQEGFRSQSTGYSQDNGSVLWRIAFIGSEISKREEYYADGTKKMEWLLAGPGVEESYTKYWHENGQLSFEMFWNEQNQYHGVMTKWDEEGNILEQESYENGLQVSL
ncbi:MAG: hypothetical protein WD016_04145 [Balneolaceae bacterium]